LFGIDESVLRITHDLNYTNQNKMGNVLKLFL
jgi:hypothetical protein